MYGVKVLNKLVAAWEAEAANRGYLEENTVRASSLVVIVSVIIFFQISFSNLYLLILDIPCLKWFNTDFRRLALPAAFLSKNPPAATRWSVSPAEPISAISADRTSP